MKQKFYVLVTLLVTLLSFPLQNASAQDEKLQVVASNSVIADITKNVGGDMIEVHSIVPIGRDPHEYEPLPEDIKKVTYADVIFYNGINLEDQENSWFMKLMANAHKEANKDYFAASDGVEVIYLENDQRAKDPHAWLNIENGIKYAQNICKQLSQKDPQHKELFEKNLAAYRDKLTQLNQKAQQTFDKIPSDKKLIITSEGCFKYFSKAYHIPSAYIWEINTEEEGTPEQFKALLSKIKDSQVPSLFVESSVDRRPMETISRESGLEIYDVLFTDSIAEPGEKGDSYYSMMAHNLKVIAEGLSQ